MNKAKALSILGLNQSADDKEIKKKFKKLAKKLHPDVNKEANAENEYKKISEAFEYLKDPPPERQQVQNRGGGFWRTVSDFFNVNQQTHPPRPVSATINISFKESVLGCTKKIELTRGLKCDDCDGNGNIKTGPECEGCNGVGQVTQTQGAFTFVSTCTDCSGAGCERESCNKCSGAGCIEGSSSLDVKIDGGILNGQRMRLGGGGHYHKNMGFDGYGNAILTVIVSSESNMRISGRNVISIVDISLLEAIKGTSKLVKTVVGEISLKVNPKIKHKDQLKVKGYGVERKGDHLFEVNIKYPNDTEKLIEFLEENNV